MNRIQKLVYFIVLIILYGVLFTIESKAAITFTISNPAISGSDEVEVDASISGLISSSCSTSGCYLQAQLRVLDESKSYFGYTYNNSPEFVDYFSPTSVDEIKTKLFNFIPTSGSWSGKLRAKNNPNDASYVGPGQYTLRFRRFTGNSTTATSEGSNALTISFVGVTPTPTPNPTEVPTSTPTDSPAATSTLTPSLTPTPTTKPTSTLTPTPKTSPTISPEVLGEETDDNTFTFSETFGNDTEGKDDSEKDQEETAKKSFPFIAGVFIVAGGVLIGYASVPFFRKWKSKYNKPHEENGEEIAD